MTTNSRHIVPRLVVLSVMAFLLACPSAFAQDDAFRKGIAAQKNGRWADVESAMREAIAKDPKESSRKIGGLLTIGGEEYVPYFLLGEALFRRMDCGGALTAWEESDRQGIARKNATRARTIETGYAQCEAKGYLVGTKFVKEVAEARAVYSAANAEYAALTREIEAYPDVKTDGVARSNARSRISEAGTRLASGESHATCRGSCRSSYAVRIGDAPDSLGARGNHDGSCRSRVVQNAKSETSKRDCSRSTPLCETSTRRLGRLPSRLRHQNLCVPIAIEQ